MKESDDKIAEMADRARNYAALSVVFDPVKAVQTSFGTEEYDPPVAARIMGFLRADCTTAEDGEGWIMRQSPRDRVLDRLGPEGIAQSVEWDLPDDPLATTMRSTLTASPDVVTGEIESVLNNSAPDLDRLNILARALELAGNASGAAYDKLPALQGMLNRHHTIRRAEEQLAEGYFGNEALRERLGSWIDNPQETKLARALYIQGIPGVGKSFLLTKLVQEARERSDPIVLWLDFDRRGLNLVDPEGLTMELARQLGNELPESAVELAQMRARFSGESAQDSSKRGSRTMPFALVEAMGAAVRAAGRNVLLVLDTLEVLASYGRTHPQRLFAFLDDLLGFGVAPTAIIAAGRGEALATLGKKRVEDVLLLSGLPDRVARMMLEKLETPEEAVEPVLQIAHGNPLILRLAAKLARDGGAQAVEIENMAGEPPEIAGGYLYRAILSRIDGDSLCEIANLGLVMDRVDAGAIANVIAPALGMEISEEESSRLLEQLSSHHWLVEEEPGGWVRHRSDVRQVVLKLLYADRREQVTAVNRAAARYLADKDPVAALYHQLQALDPDDTLPTIDTSLATQFSETMIEELPDHTADAILHARRELSRSARSEPARNAAGNTQQNIPPKAYGTRRESAKRSIDEAMLTDLLILLEKGDLIEARSLFEALFDDIPGPQEAAGVAAMCYFWLSGQWSKAHKLFRQVKKDDYRHASWKGAEALVHLVLLEMRAEFDFDALVSEFERDDKTLLNAQHIYRDAKALRLTEGALAFALLAERRATTISDSWRETVGAAGTGLRDETSQDFARKDAMALRERHGFPVKFGDNPPWQVAACLNPYSAPVAMLVSLRMSPTLQSYLMAVASHFGTVSHMPFDIDQSGGITRQLTGRPEVSVGQLGALGATADWLSAFSFFKQVADVPLIARRAEAWRRSAAGQWVYGSNAPEAWVEPEFRLDHGTLTWLERLLSTGNPVEEAARQLLFWYDPATAEHDQSRAMGQRPSMRLARALRFAKRTARRTADNPERAAVRALMARHVGRAIAVPMAVLATTMDRAIDPDSRTGLLARIGGPEFARILQQEE
ncbi:MAG: ATP-binding protein [Pseudomonadota bacterium]